MNKLLRVIVPLFVLGLVSSCAPARIHSAVLPNDAAAIEARILAEVNRQRKEKRLKGLAPLPSLHALAREQSRDMASHNYIGHVDSSDRNLDRRVRDARIRGWREVAENVGRSYGYERGEIVIVREWMKSPHHRENILNGRFNVTGIGVSRGEDANLYVTQIYAYIP